MRLAVKFLALFAVLFASISSAFATDTSTWKNPDLFVKRDMFYAGHILGGKPSDGSANAYYLLPAIAAGAGAGTGPTVAISGTDVAGKITITSGTTPTVSAVVATITFGRAFKTNSFVMLEPANAATQALAVAAQCYPTSTTTNWALNTGATGLTASTAYVWNYFVLGN